MFLGGILEVAIGIIFVFLVFSFAVMQFVELYATIFNIRGLQLMRAIQNMLGRDMGQWGKFFNHHIVESYRKKPKGNRKPSYIDGKDFANIVIDLVLNAGSQTSRIQHALRAVPSDDKEIKKLIKKVEEVAVNAAADEIEKLHAEIKAKLAKKGHLDKYSNKLSEISTSIKTQAKQIKLVLTSADVKQMGKKLQVEKELDELTKSLETISAAEIPSTIDELKSSEAFKIIKKRTPDLAKAFEYESAEEVIEDLISNSEVFAGAESNLSQFIKSNSKKIHLMGEAVDHDIASLRDSVTDWFDNTMKRTKGWYTRHTKAAALFIGLILAVLFNVDAIQITETLWTQPTLRSAIVTTIENTDLSAYSEVSDSEEESVQEFDSAKFIENQQKITSELESKLGELGLPIGWEAISKKSGTGLQSKCEESVIFPFAIFGCYQPYGQKPITSWSSKLKVDNEFYPGLIIKLIGWAVTAIAGTQGAPFWFDLLNKVMNIRGTGDKPDKNSDTQNGENSNEGGNL